MTTSVEQYSKFFQDLRNFSDSSLSWCTKQSEDALDLVLKAINELMEDAERISNMSAESLTAVNKLRSTIEVKLNTKDPSKAAIANLITGLKSLCKDQSEIRDIVSPLIEAMQFQDRMTQNINNIKKMIDCWLEVRKSISPDGVTQDEENRFADKLYAFTTMKEERDVIEAHYPYAVRPQEGDTSATEFF